MKKSNLTAGAAYILAGVLCLWAALRTEGRLGSLLFGFGGAGIGPGIMMVGRYLYWSRPQNQERYAERLEKERIDMHDELKSKLRDQSGRYAYLTGIVVLCLSIAAISLLDAFSIIDCSRWMILFLGGYLAFQLLIGKMIFRSLMKKYE